MSFEGCNKGLMGALACSMRTEGLETWNGLCAFQESLSCPMSDCFTPEDARRVKIGLLSVCEECAKKPVQ